MPYYEYHCPANGLTLEVRHGMDRRVETWGELAGLAGANADDVPADTPVERLLSVPAPVPAAGASLNRGGCGSGCACAPD